LRGKGSEGRTPRALPAEIWLEGVRRRKAPRGWESLKAQRTGYGRPRVSWLRMSENAEGEGTSREQVQPRSKAAEARLVKLRRGMEPYGRMDSGTIVA
jgi:hypothetical protein